MTTTYIERTLDITAGKHQGNDESREAYKKNRHVAAEQRSEVLRLITARPSTMKEVAVLMGVPLHTISGRGSELKKAGLIEPTGAVRQGSAELLATGGSDE